MDAPIRPPGKGTGLSDHDSYPDRLRVIGRIKVNLLPAFQLRSSVLHEKLKHPFGGHLFIIVFLRYKEIDMGIAKLDEFSVRDNRIARYAKALGHPARVAILRFLAAKQSCVCGDIVEELPLSQSTVSQHLKELKEAGLIQGEIEGKRVCYCIDPKEWERAKRSISELMDNYKEVAANCC